MFILCAANSVKDSLCNFLNAEQCYQVEVFEFEPVELTTTPSYYNRKESVGPSNKGGLFPPSQGEGVGAVIS